MRKKEEFRILVVLWFGGDDNDNDDGDSDDDVHVDVTVVVAATSVRNVARNNSIGRDCTLM